MTDTQGKIVIVGTPLGNLGDLSPRALEALRAADAVCAEDTRVTGNLLAAFNISKPLVRLDEASMRAKAAGIVARAAVGETIAFCSDAGMPGVSDPGMRLVDLAHSEDVPVEVVPGPTAATTAYVASGATSPTFYFGGFFPRKGGEQERLLGQLASLDAALIFYESPKRIAHALEAIARCFPHRCVAVCRELTKLHEEVVRGAAAEVSAEFARREADGGVRGEIVIVIDGPTAAERAAEAADADADAHAQAMALAAQGLRAKEIAKHLVLECGIARNAAYDIALVAVAATEGESS